MFSYKYISERDRQTDREREREVTTHLSGCHHSILRLRPLLYIVILILLHICPRTTVCVRILLYMCPNTTMCPLTTMCPHTTTNYVCGAQGERPATNSTVCGRRQFQRSHITIHELYTLWQKSISTHAYYYPRTLQFVAEVNYNARISLSTCPHTATYVVRRGGASDLELYLHVNATLPPRQHTQPTRPTKPLAIILANSRAESLNPPAITISGVAKSCVSSAALIHSRHPASSVCLFFFLLFMFLLVSLN